MIEENITYKYYMVGTTPVKVKYEDGKLRGAYALDRKTNDFKIKHTYLSEISKSEIGTDKVTKEEFDKKVKAIMDRKKKSKPSNPGM